MKVQLTREEAATICAAHIAIANAQLLQRATEAEYRSGMQQAQASQARYGKLMEDLTRGVCDRLGIPYTDWQEWDFEGVDTTSFAGEVEIPDRQPEEEDGA